MRLVMRTSVSACVLRAPQKGMIGARNIILSNCVQETSWEC